MPRSTTTCGRTGATGSGGRWRRSPSAGSTCRPATLQGKAHEAIAVISKCVDDAGFEIREGILAHDTAAMDTFRLPVAGMSFTLDHPAGGPDAGGRERR